MNRVLSPWLILTALLLSSLSYATGQSSSSEDLRQSAIALEEQGRASEAEAAWQSVLKMQPKSAEALAHLGFLASKRQDFSQAISLYKKALVLSPEMPGLRLNLGLSYFKSGDLKDAAETIAPLAQAAAQSSPERQRLSVIMGMAYYGQNRFADSIPYLQEAVSNDSRSLELRLILVQSCMGAKQFDCVRDVYKQIVDLNPYSAEADMVAGEVLDEMKNDPEAIQQFQAAIAANPKEPNAHFSLGYMFWKLKRYDEARGQFEAELENVPDHYEAQVYLADTEMQLQKTEQALPLLEDAVRKIPTMELGHLDLGLLYDAAGRKKEALRELSTAAKLEPGDATVHWRLARLYRSLGDENAANAELSQTKQMVQEADNSVFRQLHPAQK